MEKKNTILLTVIAIVTVLIVATGATYAYFTAQISTENLQNSSTEIKTKALANAKMDMGSKLEVTNALPGYKALKTVTVTGQCGGGATTCDSINAKIVLKPSVADFTGHVRYSLYKIATANASNGVTCTNIDTTTGLPKTGVDYDTNQAVVDPNNSNIIQFFDTVSCSRNQAELVASKENVVFVDGQNEEIPVTVSGGMNDTYYVVIEYVNATTAQDNEQGKTFSINMDFVSDVSGNTSPSGTNYMLTFNANGGNIDIPSKNVENGKPYGELPIPAYEGYDFEGWYTDIEFTNRILDNQIVNLNKNSTVYAKWKAKEVIVSFDSKGGSAIENKTVLYGSKYNELKTPIKDGYVFLGWYLGEELITSSSIVTTYVNHTLQAKYDVQNISITFDYDGGDSTLTTDITYDTLFKDLPIPTKTGYTFEGWYINDTKINLDSKVGEYQGQTIKAKYTANKYTITLDASNGTTPIDRIEVTYDSTYANLPTPTRSGYNFIGWFTDLNDGIQITSTTKVLITEPQTLYAKWSAQNDIVYTVKHWQQNIGGESNSHDATNYTLVKTDSLVGITDASVTPDTNTYIGFTSPNKESVVISSDGSSIVNYYYTRNSYTLTIQKDAGVNTVDAKTSYQYGENVNIMYAIKDGYTFKNIMGDKTTSSFEMPASNIAITINTSENTYTITYNLNGGALSSNNPISYTVTSSAIVLQNPSKVGYTFIGWTGSNGTTPQTDITIPTGSTGNRNYVANFTPNTYKVSFNANGGNTVATVLTVTYDATYGDTFPVPTRAGYTFDGWFTEANGGIEITNTSKVEITESQTLYAHWTGESYTVTINANALGSVNTTSLNIHYGGTNTFTVTPSSGNYLSSIDCTNGYTTNAKTGTSSTAMQTVTISNGNNASSSTCTVTFAEPPVSLNTYLINKAKTDTTNLVYDGTVDNNLRYIGADPNNYVTFNNETWRIIGVMNNVADANGNKASHVKIIRNESIGRYAWDISGTYGVGNWANSTIMNVLNTGAYWNRNTGTCPKDNGTTVNCNFSNSGLTAASKSLISNITWSLGGVDIGSDTNASKVYSSERGANVYSGYSTTWKGYVGLLYPSDFGFATNGNGSEENRIKCLTYMGLSNYNSPICDGNWLSNDSNLSPWTITSALSTTYQVYKYDLKIRTDTAKMALGDINPVVYLKTDIMKTSGDGSIDSPFVIQ